MRSKFSKVIPLILVIIILQSCSINKGYSTPEEAFKETNIPSNGLLKKIEVDGGAILFYEGLNQDIGVGLVRKKSNRWNWIFGSGMVTASTDQDITLSWTNLDNLRKAGEGYNIFWGSVNNDNISKINIQHTNSTELNDNAQFFETPWGYEIWYVIRTNYLGTNPGVKVTGFNDQGEVVFKKE